MTRHGAFVWRVRLSLLLLAFGSLMVKREEAAQAPVESSPMVASSASRAGVLPVNAAAVKRATADRPPKRREAGQRHLADPRIKAALTAPGPQ
jgi:hypothetical protein